MGGNKSLPVLPYSNLFLVLPGKDHEFIPYVIPKDHQISLINLQRNRIKTLPSNLSQLKTLLLSSNEIEVISADLKKSLESYPSLKTLDLSRNKLRVFSIMIPSLENLNLFRNRISECFQIGESLQELDLNSNMLSELCFESASLKKLFVSQNKISRVRDNISFVNLTELNLSYNCIKTIPNIAQICPQIVKLNLSYNKLETFDSEIPETLNELDLSYNLLQSIPKLNNGLEILNVNDNRIITIPSLPESIKKFYCDKNSVENATECDVPQLEILTMSFNRMSEMPKYNNRKRTSSVLFAHNQIQLLNIDLILHNTEMLYFSGNQIESLPEEIFLLPKLHTVSFDRNNIYRIPSSLSQSNIKYLSISGNPIVDLPSMPKNLETLIASYCSISDVAPLNLQECDHLFVVDFCGNKLSDFPYLSSCCKYYLSQNDFIQLPRFSDVSKVIDVSMNQLISIDNITTYTQLTEFDASYNQIKRLPDFEFMTNLTILKLAFNPMEGDFDLKRMTKLSSLDTYQTSIHIHSSSQFAKDIISSCNQEFKHREFISTKSGYSETQGFREEMEDSIVVRDDIGLYAVFDGHGGSDTAIFSAYYLSHVIDKTITKAKQLNDIINRLQFEVVQNKLQDGSTMTLALLLGEVGLIAHIGDSRAIVVAQGGSFRVLTKDHKPYIREEFDKIIEKGGYVVDGRTDAVLAVSRSIGDNDVGGLNREADVFTFQIETNDKYLIIGCDGVFDVLDNQYVAKLAIESRTPSEAAYRIRCCSLSNGSQDNISVIVVDLAGK